MTIELLDVPVGAIAVTVAFDDAPVMAGNVTVAAWPTLTSAMSASAMAAVTVNFETSAIVMKAEDDVDELVDELPVPPVPVPPVEPVPLELLLDELLPPDTVSPTWPFTATTRPAMGDVSVAFASASSALVSVVWAVATVDSCEKTCCCACTTLCPGEAAACASAVRSSARMVLSWLRFVFALVTAVDRSAVCRVPSTSPAVTVAPSATLTVAIVPDAPNEASTSCTGAIVPDAVIVVDTAPCSTVPVSCVVAEAVVAANGWKTISAPAAAMTITAMSTVLITTGRENFMGE